jgi:hypothetical protein
MEAEAATAALSESSDLEVQHQSVKRPRTLTDESPDQVGKIPARVPLLLIIGAPETLQQPSSTALNHGRRTHRPRRPFSHPRWRESQ